MITPILHLDSDYINFLDSFKTKLKHAQMRAALAVNKELILFYWQLGNELIAKQKQFKWGSQVLKQFSHDMQQAFPEMQGLSVSNLERMKKFALEYPTLPNSAQAVRELPWGHIVTLIHKVKDKIQRDWYAEKTIENGWSRSILEMQIETDLYSRQAIAPAKTTNFDKNLPVEQSRRAIEILKDPYNFDFLTISNKAHERDIENALILHVRDFLLELGQGFAYVGSQVPLNIDDQEFFIDLLFYHLELRCYCVVELKSTKFKPEHTGQLGFYLAVVDDQLRKETDNKTIGILLCKTNSKIIAEYALDVVNAPIGISEYQLTKAIPEKLRNSLPSIQEIENELNVYAED
jgi:predicted nuclease of restriction endonuclease-like (RecB) superfamily